MYIYPELKMIYICVPKTASNSYHNAMDKRWKKQLPEVLTPQIRNTKKHSVYEMKPKILMYQHFTARHAKTIIKPEIWNSYEKIGFIRHPYQWVPSLYNQHVEKVLCMPRREKCLSDFVRTLTFTPMTWLTDEQGELMIDTVWKTENLDEFCKKYDCEHLHKHKGKPHKSLSDADKEIIDEKFKREWEFYDR